MLRRIGVNLLVHLIFVIGYPDLGPNGMLYVAISFVIWSLIIMIGGIVLNGIRFILGPLKVLESVILAVGIGFCLAYIMPQADGVRVIDKLKNWQLPSGPDIKRGITNVGLDTATKLTAEAVAEQARNAAKGMEKAATTIESKTGQATAATAEKVEQAAQKVEEKADELADSAKKKSDEAAKENK